MTVIEKLRKPRIEILEMRISVFDLSLTLIGGYILGKQLGYNPILMSISMLPLGIVVHEILGIETQISRKIKS